jgi:hypothetical protein
MAIDGGGSRPRLLHLIGNLLVIPRDFFFAFIHEILEEICMKESEPLCGPVYLPRKVPNMMVLSNRHYIPQ